MTIFDPRIPGTFHLSHTRPPPTPRRADWSGRYHVPTIRPEDA